MWLLDSMSYHEFKVAEALSLERCHIIARLANVNIQFSNTEQPGKQLLNTLNTMGCSADEFRRYLKTALETKIVHTYNKPVAKVAILIANNRYCHLSRLSTPPMDCDSLKCFLNTLGFVVVTIKNMKCIDLKNILERIFDVVPEDSYCFIFYAGHGCELGNMRFILGVECPTENIEDVHSTAENFLLNTAAKCKPDLCILVMDMCRISLDRATNPSIYETLLSIPPITIPKNLLISYSTQPAQSAYELIELECSTSIANDVTYEIQTGDTNRIVPKSSQYVNALYTRLEEDLDVSSMLDRVHEDVEKSMREQRPIKVQCGMNKRSLYDPVKGNIEELCEKLKEVEKKMSEVITYEYSEIVVSRPTKLPDISGT